MYNGVKIPKHAGRECKNLQLSEPHHCPQERDGPPLVAYPYSYPDCKPTGPWGT